MGKKMTDFGHPPPTFGGKAHLGQSKPKSAKRLVRFLHAGAHKCARGLIFQHMTGIKIHGVCG